MKTRVGFGILSLLLVCVMGLHMAGCTMQVSAQDLMEGITPNRVSELDDLGSMNSAVTDFAVRLFRACAEEGKSTLISPLSVLCALAMTANGAQKETLAQMESVLGLSASELNQYLYSYVKHLPQGEKYRLSLANSVWFTEDERFEVNRDFLQANADYYGAEIYKAPFDQQTLRDINGWVKRKTDNRIPKVLNSIPDDVVMYLVNALAFEAEWMTIYEKHQVAEGEFTTENGVKQRVEFMRGAEGAYLEDENASGFLKYYAGGKYAFVAMLPHEGVSVAEYLASLNGESLSSLLSAPQYTTVRTAMPKFEIEYSTEMSEILMSMGMTDAFDVEKANFEGLGTFADSNLYISRVIHKTFISVGEKGTKAGAVTVVEKGEGTSVAPQEPKVVCLDRPFVYLLVDCENRIPFFIGTLMEIAKA